MLILCQFCLTLLMHVIYKHDVLVGMYRTFVEGSNTCLRCKDYLYLVSLPSVCNLFRRKCQCICHIMSVIFFSSELEFWHQLILTFLRQLISVGDIILFESFKGSESNLNLLKVLI